MTALQKIAPLHNWLLSGFNLLDLYSHLVFMCLRSAFYLTWKDIILYRETRSDYHISETKDQTTPNYHETSFSPKLLHSLLLVLFECITYSPLQLADLRTTHNWSKMTIMRRATWLQVNVVPVVLWVSRWGSCQVVITPSEYIHCAQVQIKRKHCMILHDHWNRFALIYVVR